MTGFAVALLAVLSDGDTPAVDAGGPGPNGGLWTFWYVFGWFAVAVLVAYAYVLLSALWLAIRDRRSRRAEPGLIEPPMTQAERHQVIRNRRRRMRQHHRTDSDYTPYPEPESWSKPLPAIREHMGTEV